jgi:hypothetical protein
VKRPVVALWHAFCSSFSFSLFFALLTTGLAGIWPDQREFFFRSDTGDALFLKRRKQLLLFSQLALNQATIVAMGVHKLLVRTLFDNCPIIQYRDQIGSANGPQRMRENDTRTDKTVQVLLDNLLRDGIQMAGGFIK